MSAHAPNKVNKSAKQAAPQSQHKPKKPIRPTGKSYAAIDLGTNNCRLLIVEAGKKANAFRVRDSFSRIVRLGEGLSANGCLSEAAMHRTLAALKICASKIRRNKVRRIKCVATEACRHASNSRDFIARVKRETNLTLEIIDGDKEARFAAIGCGSLFDDKAKHILIFDTGGGSTEISRLDKKNDGFFYIADSVSLPLGVVRLAERFASNDPEAHGYEAMLEESHKQLAGFMARQTMLTDMKDLQIIGTSGTITTLAAVQKGLARYDRNQVDGCKIRAEDMRAIIDKLVTQSRVDLVSHPCIGEQRADLMLAGCAVFDAICHNWPVPEICVADRGLREGMLIKMIQHDKARKAGRRRKTNISHKTGHKTGHKRRGA